MSPKPRRRWYQFGLSTLLIGLTLFSLPLGYVAWEREQCRRGEQALNFLRRKSDSTTEVFRYWEGLDTRPAWLKSILGDNEFRRVDHATLEGNSVSDADLYELSRLPNLESIVIDAPNVTDNGVAHLSRLKKVRIFRFTNNQRVSGKSWKVLSGWRSLWKLYFDGTLFADGILELPMLDDLAVISLRDTNCSDAIMKRIVLLKGLDYSLDLSNTQISDASLSYLGRLTKLRYLTLENTKVTNTGLQELRKALPNTQVIDGNE